MRRTRGLAPAAAILLLAAAASAHRLAPSLLELVERDGGRFDVTWKTPLQQPVGSDVRPELPESCATAGEAQASQEATGLVVRFPVDCGTAGIVGQRLAVRGLDTSGTNALVRVALADGRRIQAVLHADDPELEIGERQGALAVAREYALLGFEHILSGLDHLLFVFGLVLLAATTRQLVWTVTSFTLGHSVTLSLAVLGYVRFPTALVELVIAMTIVALALELARGAPEAGARGSWMRRAPWAMAFGFGLLHGLGFAGALAEVGLPVGEIPAALLAFNLGIEAGQLAFVVVVLLLRALLARPVASAPAWLLRAPTFAMGGLAVYWCLDRGAGLFP
ncbi:MAG: HupE/UreJ family protein [Myxococcota bacterium]